MSKEQRPSIEIPPINEQLNATIDFINSQLDGCEPFEEEGWGENITISTREAPMLRMTDDSAVFCRDRKTLKGNGPNHKSISIHGRRQKNLYINIDGSFDFYADEGNDSLYDYEGVPYEEAVKNPDFIKLVSSIFKVITEEEVKPKIPFVRHPLLDSVIVITPTEAEADRKESQRQVALQVGYAERQLHGQDAVLIDRENNLYGVFDGVGGISNSEVAARLAAVTIQEIMSEVQSNDPDEVLAALTDALVKADQAMRLWNNEGIQTGATTATLAKIVSAKQGDYLVWASVGDSRLYLKSPNRKLYQVSNDEGEGKILHNALGHDFKGVTQKGGYRLKDGYDIILVTDGVTGDYASDILGAEEIVEVLSAAPSAQLAAVRLIDVSRKRDDKVAIVLRF